MFSFSLRDIKKDVLDDVLILVLLLGAFGSFYTNSFPLKLLFSIYTFIMGIYVFYPVAVRSIGSKNKITTALIITKTIECLLIWGIGLIVLAGSGFLN